MKHETIKVFIINLKKDKDKREHMRSLCSKYFIDYEFIEAVDGELLSEKDIEKSYSKEKAILEIGRDLGRGEIGCALSHRNIYNLIVSTNIKIALILEDDVYFDDDLLKILNLLYKLPEDMELILFGHHNATSRKIEAMSSIWKKIKLTNKYSLLRPCETGYGAYGYLLTKNGAKKLLNQLDIIIKPIDHYIGSILLTNIYIISPPVINIHKSLTEKSNLNKDRCIMESIYKRNSYRKHLLKSLGLYEISVFLRSVRNDLKNIIKKIKPIREYEY